MANFTFTGRGMIDTFTVQADNRFAAFDAARAMKPELLDVALVRGDGLCPGCNGDGILSDDPMVLVCRSCGGFFTVPPFPITLDQALKFVAWHLPMLANPGADGSFFFDLDVVNADGTERTRLHGWADRKTKRVVQWG